MTSNTETQNKRIAKNTIALYVRMAFSMAVGLYSSRVVLQVLGVTDFGLWNVVAGVVTMFQFLNSSMSGCSSRFISYELGKGERGCPQKIFSVALTIHIIIALVIVLLCETVGLFFLLNKLVISENRLHAAFVVFQLSVVGSFFTVTQVPYNASIIANEKMNIFAYIELLNVFLRLAILFLLEALPGDHLIVYGELMLGISIFIAFLYRVYCVRCLNYCKFKLSLEPKAVKAMLSFSLWDLYGNGAVMARTQGVNMLLNMFFSAAMNAASAVATSVQNATMALAANVVSAFRPQIVKCCACKDYKRMTTLINNAAIYTTILLLLFSIPLWVEMDFVLKLWLKDPPEYASTFCRLILVFNLFANLSSVVVAGVHATGKIKRTSFVNGTLYLLVIPFSYFVYMYGGGASAPYYFNIGAVCLGMIQNIFVLRKNVPFFSVVDYIKIVAKFIIMGTLLFVGLSALGDYIKCSIIRFSVICCLNCVLLLVVSVVWIFDKSDQSMIKNKLTNMFRGRKWNRNV